MRVITDCFKKLIINARDLYNTEFISAARRATRQSKIVSRGDASETRHELTGFLVITQDNILINRPLLHPKCIYDCRDRNSLYIACSH